MTDIFEQFLPYKPLSAEPFQQPVGPVEDRLPACSEADYSRHARAVTMPAASQKRDAESSELRVELDCKLGARSSNG
jgi:hypothetical protein